MSEETTGEELHPNVYAVTREREENVAESGIDNSEMTGEETGVGERV